MSGNIQCTFYALSLLILVPRRRVLYYPYFSGKLRQRKVRKVTQDHVASKWERQDSNPEPGCKIHSLNSDIKLPPIDTRWIK